MAFIHELRSNTKTQSQLAYEKEESERKQYEMSLHTVHEQMKSECMDLARKGHHEAEITIGAYASIPWLVVYITTKERAVRFSTDLAELLRADGFENLKFRVKRLSGYRDAFNATFRLKW